MKKVLALVLVAMMVIGSMTGCSSKGESVKTGLAVLNSVGSSTSATADAAGVAEVDSFVAAVLVDKDGKITDCKIDIAQTKINFDATGKVTSDLNAVVKSKQELKEDYGMKKASGIGKEWYEQANAFAAYCVGKTVDEIKNIAVNDQGTAGDADLAASITVHIGDFIEGVAKAAENAQDLGAKKGDKLGLGIETSISGSADAAADTAGKAEAYSYYTATTFGKSDKITSSLIDASISDVNFDTTGTITSDLTVAPQTKQELKEGYGMKKSSAIGKEWYEEANSFAKYVVGKTADEVNGIPQTEGKATGADLTASVTIHITSFQDIITRAFNSTK